MSEEYIPENPDKQPSRVNKRPIIIFVLIMIAVIGGILLYYNEQTNTSLLDCTATNITANLTMAFNQGVSVAITQLRTATDGCQIVGINYGDINRSFVDVKCVQALLQSYNITTPPLITQS